MTRRSTISLSVLVALTLSGAACGSKSGGAKSSSTSTTPTSSTSGSVTSGTTAATSTSTGTSTSSPTTPTTGTGTSAGSGTTTTPTQGQVGSRYWYVNDQFGNPFKTNGKTEAQLAKEVLDLVNVERTSRGLKPLVQDTQAERAAKAQAEDMSGRAFFSHITPEGWGPLERLQMTGASGFSGYGENIAYGQPTAKDVMTAWMNSTGHRANILNPAFTHLGVGVVESTRFWTQVFLTR